MGANSLAVSLSLSLIRHNDKFAPKFGQNLDLSILGCSLCYI